MYETLKSETVFDGKLLKLELLEIDVGSGRTASREIVRHAGAVAALARIPDGRFVFVRQFRKAVEKELLEIVAGRLEPGEQPELCARRELKEETGYDVAELYSLGGVYNAPGYCSEKLYLFFAELRAERGAQACDEDEHVTVVLLSASEFEAQVAAGRIEDAKTLAAWLAFEKMKTGGTES